VSRPDARQPGGRPAEKAGADQNGKNSEIAVWFQRFFETLPQPAALYSEQGEPISLNPAFQHCYGWSIEELTKDVSVFIPQSESKDSLAYFDEALAGKAGQGLSTRRLTKKGLSRDILWQVTRCDGFDGNPLGHLEIYTDQAAEQALRDSINEKEVLLQEIHHRLKNNMQVIASMLGIQKMQITDPMAKRVFSQSQDRIRAMAMVHESVYQSGTFAKIQLNHYVRNICNALYRSYCDNPRQVKMLVQVEPARLGLDEAVPLGLALNELVTNAFKHGFPDDAAGEVLVQGRVLPGASLELIVSDNGVGLPPDLDVASASGLYMVCGLVEQQLKGSIKLGALDAGGGAKIVMRFAPKPNEE
jgi:PAS domain S-box-containing protein